MEYDIVVVGAGNAALCAAVAASEAGARVLVLEKAPPLQRGGNTQFTALYRFAYDGLDALRRLCPAIDDTLAARMRVPPYKASMFLDDLMASSRGRADRWLMQIVADESYPTMEWLTAQGIRWVPSLEGAKEVDGMLTWQPGIVIYPEGGGLTILATLFDRLEKSGAQVSYHAPVLDLLRDDHGRVCGVKAAFGSGRAVDVAEVRARSVILGAGGFEASPEKRARYLGPGWDLVKVRGSRHNTGECLDMAIRHGAATTGQWSGCHATMVRADGSPYEMGEAAFPHAYPLSVVVNSAGERFADEGENFQYYTYAKLGRAVIGQRDGRAFQVFDGKSIPLRHGDWLGARAYDSPCARADDLVTAARMAGIEDLERFMRTIAQFNAAIEDTPFDPSRLDGRRTRGLPIDKTNWALAIDTPPFEVVPVECGITFSFGGLRFNEHAQVLDSRGLAIEGLYVVGEMAGTFFHNYVGGSGLTKGATFGRRAGTHAALACRQ